MAYMVLKITLQFIRPFRFTRAIARDRVSTRANETTGAFDRSRKTLNRVECRSVILEAND